MNLGTPGANDIFVTLQSMTETIGYMAQTRKAMPSIPCNDLPVFRTPAYAGMAESCNTPTSRVPGIQTAVS